MPLQACLIGMGFVKEAFYHNVWSHIVALSMMYVLGSMENLQMLGIILGMNKHDFADESSLCYDLQSAAGICFPYGRKQNAAN